MFFGAQTLISPPPLPTNKALQISLIDFLCIKYIIKCLTASIYQLFDSNNDWYQLTHLWHFIYLIKLWDLSFCKFSFLN